MREGKKLTQTVNEVLKSALEGYSDRTTLSSGIRKAIGLLDDNPRIHLSIEIEWASISRFREAAIPPFNMQTCIGALLEMHTPPL